MYRGKIKTEVTDEKLDYDKVIEDLVALFENCSDRGTISTICASKDWHDRIEGLKEILHGVIKKSTLKYFHGSVYWYNGKIYVPIINDVLYRALNLYLRKIGVGNSDILQGLKYLISEVFRSLKLWCMLDPTFHIQAYRNGVLDLTTRELHPFSPDFHVIYLHDFDYDPKAKCPLWMEFLKTVLPEKESRHILQMYLGLCTFDRGKMTDKVENCLMLYGNGSNGKSVIFETVSGIFGKENVSGIGLLSLIKGGDERMRNIAAIDGKVVNVCPEVQAKDISGYEDAFKALCSGEGQYGRKIGGNVYAVRNVPWLIFNMNALPKSTDGSHGFFRRFLYVIFGYIVPDEMQNKHLAYDLRQEYPGILNWIIRGGQYLKKRGFIFPKSGNSEKERLMVMGESNVTMSWAYARGIRCSASVKGELFTWIKASALYDDMVKYAEANGFAPVDITSFGRAMSKLGFNGESRKRTSTGMLYKAYCLTEEDLNEPVPVVSDMELTAQDLLDRDVEYDEDDL